MIYGYARVSTKTQNEARQIDALLEYGVKRRQIFVDRCSGKDFAREQYRLLRCKMKRGDTLVVQSIDRLGRNYKEILYEWRGIVEDEACSIVVLDMPLLDTRRANDLTERLISDIVLQLLSYVAETERSFIRKRQTEGIAAAKKRGIRFGRAPKKRPMNYPSIKKKWEQGRITAREAARRLGVSHSTFLSWAKYERKTSGT